MKMEHNFQNLWDTAKTLLRGKFIGILAYLKKQENSQPYFMPKGTRKRRTKPKVSRKKGIIKIRVEINEIEINNRKDQRD